MSSLGSGGSSGSGGLLSPRSDPMLGPPSLTDIPSLGPASLTDSMNMVELVGWELMLWSWFRFNLNKKPNRFQ